MTSITVKFRPSSIIQKEGTLHYQIIHHRKVRKLRTGYKLFPSEWNSTLYNPQIQISAESGTKRSIFRQKNKTKRSKKRLHTTLIKPEQKVNEDLCSGFVLS